MVTVSDIEYATHSKTDKLGSLMKTWFLSSRGISRISVCLSFSSVSTHTNTSSLHLSALRRKTFADDTVKVARRNGASEKVFFQSKAKVAGVFAVVGVIVAAIILVSLYFFHVRRNRRRRHLNDEKGKDSSVSSGATSKRDGLPANYHYLERNQSCGSSGVPDRRKSNWSWLSYFKGSTSGLPDRSNSRKGLYLHDVESQTTSDDPMMSPLQEFEQRMAPYSMFDSKESIQCAGNDYISSGNELFVTNPE